SNTQNTTSNNNTINDPLHLARFDHLGMVLTNTPFNGGNFLGWSKNVKMALGAKLKLGFIDEAFLYAQSAYELWKEIAKRYKQSNGPLIYQLESELSKITQSVLDKVLERDSHLKLIQFLMKLSDEYESVRSQILAMDPLPNVNKAYYIVQQIKKQKQVTSYTFEPFASFANTNNTRHNNNTRKEVKQSRVDNRSDQKRTCTHCVQEDNEIRLGQNGNVDQRLVAAVCSETMKMFKGKGIVEDLTTKEIVAVGNGSRCLYICKPMVDPAGFAASIDEFQKSHQFSSLFIFLNKTAYNNVVNTESNLDIQLFHARLGHTSISKLVHIPKLTKPHKDKFDNRDIPLHPTPEFPVFGDSKATEEPFVSHTPLPQTNPNIEFDHPNSPSSSADFHQHPPNGPHFLNIPSAPARKSSRTSTRPAWMKDFVTKGTTGSAAFCSRQPQYPLFGKADFAVTDKGWVEAMNKELQALEKNNIWELTTLPLGHKPITLKWVFKIKYYPDGSLDKFKARLVVRGYTKAAPNQVCQLKRSLYGLKQSPRQWNHELTMFFISLGYVQSKHDYSLFVKNANGKFTAVLVYVDDMLITSDCQQEILFLKQALHQKFTIKDLGLAKYFLEIELCRTSVGTYLNQRKYILDLLSDTGLTAAKPKEFPLPIQLKLSLNKCNPLKDPGSYRRLVGRLLYLTKTRPDISYAVQHLSQFVSFPKDVHMQDALHLLKYLKGIVSKGLFYPIQSHLKLTGFSDADWAFLSISSTEAEYRSMAATTCELLWLSYLLKNLNIPTQCPVTLFCANKSAQQIAANLCYHDKTKHLDINCHFTRDKVQDGFLQTAYIPTQSQIADVMTKALGAIQHSNLSFKLGLAEPPT
nr:hypothetical protein [Tanacetum cinerariifolium]